MQRYLISLLLLPLSLSAAISTNANWDVRTTGNANNGGCYDATVASAGTDFSTQNSAQIAYTDMVLGAGGTTFTSAAHPVDGTVVANCIQVISGTGCTAGFYQVASRAGTTATLDRSAGTAASTCTANLGGGILDPAVALSNATSSSSAPAVGNVIWIKTGTYTITTEFLITKLSIQFEGYGTTHGDLGTKPLITTATNSVNIFNGGANNVSQWDIFRNLSLSSTAATRGKGITSTNNPWYHIYIDNCIFDGFSVAIDSLSGASFIGDLNVFNSEIKNSVTEGIFANQGALIMNSYIHNNGAEGILTTVGPTSTAYPYKAIVVINSIIANNTTNGIGQTGASRPPLHIYNNTFYGNGAAGILAMAGNFGDSGSFLVNNIFYNNTTYGLNGSANPSHFVRVDHNAFGANGSGATNNMRVGSNGNFNTTGAGTITLTANPFVNAAGGNFALNNTAGGGALLRNLGIPGAFPAGTTTGSMSVGAAQVSAPAVQVGYPILQ